MDADGDRDGITGINVTPLVDVTLVLLIVFMVTARVIVSRTFEVDVPRVSSATSVTQTTLAFTIDDSDRVSVDGRVLAVDDDLQAVIGPAHSADREVRAVLHVSGHAHHAAVVRVMDALRAAHVTRIAFAVRQTR